MRTRAAAILIENNAVALIERHRAGMHYFVFPGGGVEPGETPDQAAIREMYEETGLQIEVVKLVAEVWHKGNRQFFYLVTFIGGVFGAGTGEEYSHAQTDGLHSGAYQPVWMPLDALLSRNVLPHCIAIMTANRSWPEPIPVFEEA